MEFENDNYISKLLTDSSKIENLNDLLSFLERLDPDRIEKQIGAENTTSFQFSEEVHPKYLMYEKHWLRYLSTLRDIILSGETNLSRVVKQIQDALTIKRPNEMEKAVFFGKLRKVPSEVVHPWKEYLNLTFLKKYCSPDMDCVIEMGSGPALFLFKFYLTNGPLNADYYGLEICSTARLCVNIMSFLEPNLKIKSMFFDYQNPDFSALNNKYKNVLIFSRGSIESVRDLKEEVLEKILLISERLTCVHFEPVDWQIVKPHKQNRITRKHKRRCNSSKFNYNRNLWALLKKLESKRLIKINEYLINYSGKAKHHDTYISWTKIPK